MNTPTSTSQDARAGNVAIVGEIYAAFGSGDVPGVLDRLADDVSWDGDWADNFAQHQHIDHFLPRRGIGAVGEFFAYLAGCTVHEFRVLDLLASDHQVVAQIVIEVSLPNGGRYRDEELHLWTVGADGRVTALRHYIDTAKHIAAAAGENTVA